jgi:DNA-binding MarR family transcriptional regulator
MSGGTTADTAYRLDGQVGFLLRRATQRHLAIFTTRMPDLTPRQFAALAKLDEIGATSQNLLGRETAMDAATIKGVVDRLEERGLVEVADDPNDRRRRVLALTEEGRALFAELAPVARRITEETLSPLTEPERERLVALLARIG